MASNSKKKKGKNSYTYGDHALKNKFRLKRINFFNASMRQELKKILRRDL